MNEIANRFSKQLKDFNIKLSEKQLAQFDLYCQNLLEWNQVMNLTTITKVDQIYVKHFLDSLSVHKYLPLSKLEGKRVVDIGTGAGFPGLPLAIINPKTEFTLIDSLNKRIRFLEDTVQKLSLENVTCIHSRAENAGHNKELRESFDFCCSRAVANLATLSEYCLPFLKKDGLFVSYKAEKAQEEIQLGTKAVERLGGKIEKNQSFTLPDTDIGRTIVFIRKVKNTPKQYPRKAGTPSKKPIT